jgi:hypothetical protein
MFIWVKARAMSVILVAAAGLSACATSQKEGGSGESGIGLYPAEYRSIVRDYLRKTLFDPYTVRDAQISKPKQGTLYVEGTLGFHGSGWLVCFRSNSKNRMGAYTGLSDTAILIRDGRVLTSTSDPTHSNYPIKKDCDDERYEPFPEMEQTR